MKTKNKDWVTTKEMAQELGCCIDMLYRHIKNGILEPKKHFYILNPHAHRKTYKWHLNNVYRCLIGHEKPSK